MAAITLDIGGNTRRLDRDIQKTVNQVYNINLKTKGDQPLGRITGQVNEFNKSLDASNARVIAFGASAGIIFGVERAFTALLTSVVEVQKSLQGINVILNVSTKELQKFGGELFNIARNTGQTFQAVAEAATEFSRQGLGVEETLKRTSDALILSRLSGLDTVKSVEALTAAVNSFASQAVSATDIVNKFATVDAAFAVSSADLADAVARVGSSAAQSGVSLNELIAIVTSAQQTTARGGAVIGNSFKTIFTRLQRTKVVSLLESLGVETVGAGGQIKSTIQLLQDLGRVYDTLGAQQQAYVAEQVGGVFQINILKAALADLGKEYSIYNNALNVSASATDQAIKRNEELNKTYSSQLNALQENARQLAAVGGERLFGPSIERLVGGTNQLLGGFNESEAQGFGTVLGRGILDGLGQFIAGPGLVLIGGVLLKLFKDLATFATGSVKQLLGLNTAATQQRDLQSSINQILTKNPQLIELALQGEKGLNAAANQLLSSLQQQTVELQKQAALAAQLSKAFIGAGVRMSGGIPVAPTPKPGKAAGYIPNFASQKNKIGETLGAYQAGYEPGRIFNTRLYDGQGGSFMATVNSAESINTVVGPNGNKGTFVVPPTASAPMVAAKGFIPNFAYSLSQLNTQQLSRLKSKDPSQNFVTIDGKKLYPEDFGVTSAQLRTDPNFNKSVSASQTTKKTTQKESQKKLPPIDVAELLKTKNISKLPTILTPSDTTPAKRTKKNYFGDNTDAYFKFLAYKVNTKDQSLNDEFESTVGRGNFIDKFIEQNLIPFAQRIAAVVQSPPIDPDKFSEIKGAKGFRSSIEGALGGIFDAAITTAIGLAPYDPEKGDFDIRLGAKSPQERKYVTALFGGGSLGGIGNTLGDFKKNSSPEAADNMVDKTTKEYGAQIRAAYEERDQDLEKEKTKSTKTKAAGYIPNFADVMTKTGKISTAAPLVRAIDDKELRMMLSKFGKGYAFQNMSADTSAMNYGGGAGTYMWDAFAKPNSSAISDRQAYKQNVGRAKNWSSSRGANWLVRFNRDKLQNSELLPDMETSGASVYSAPLSKDQIVWPIKQANGPGRIFEKDIPAFLSGQINDAIKRETEAGIPKNKIYLAQEKALTSANPMGLGVFNSLQERNGPERKKAMRSKGFAASGFIPNFALADQDTQGSDIATAVTAVVTQLGFLAFGLQGAGQQYKQSLSELTKANVNSAKINLANVREQAKSNINYDSPAAFRESRKKGADEIRAARNEVKKAQAGTVGQKIGAAGQAGGFALALAGPILGETLKNLIGQETAGARRGGDVASAAGEIAGFAGTGAIFGPVGAAVGLAVGGLLTIPKVISSFASDFPELSKSAQKAGEELTKFSDSGAKLLTSFETLQKGLEAPGGASQEVINKASEEYAKILSGLSAEDQKRLSAAAKTGKLESEYAKILAEKTAELQSREAAANLGQATGEVETRDLLRKGASFLNYSALGGVSKISESLGGPTLQDYIDYYLPSKSGANTQVSKTNQAVFAQSITQGKTGKDALSALEKAGGTGVVKQLGQIQTGDVGSLEALLNKVIPEQEGKADIISEYIAQANNGAQDFQNVILDLSQGFLKTRETATGAQKASDALIAANEEEAKKKELAAEATKKITETLERNIRVAQFAAQSERALARSREQFARQELFADKFTRKTETAAAIVGPEAPLAEAFALREAVAGIAQSQFDGIETIKFNFVDTINKSINEAFTDATTESIGGARQDGTSADITKSNDQLSTQAFQQTRAFKEVQSVLNQYLQSSGTINLETLLTQIDGKLASANVNAETRAKIGLQLKEESSKVNSEIKLLKQESVQSFKKLAKEQLQRILIQKISQAQTFGGGINEFLNPPEPGESAFDRIVNPEGFKEFQGQKVGYRFDYKSGTNEFKYGYGEAERARKEMAPEYGREALKLITDLQSFFPGYTPNTEGKAYQASTAGVQEFLTRRVKELQEVAKSSETPQIKRDEINAALQTIPGLGGLETIAKLQVARQTGALDETQFEAITKKYQDPVLQALKERAVQMGAETPEAKIILDEVAKLARERITTEGNEPTVEAINTTNSILNDILTSPGINGQRSNDVDTVLERLFNKNTQTTTGDVTKPVQEKPEMFAQQEAALNTNTGALNSLTGGIESLRNIIANLQTSFETANTTQVNNVNTGAQPNIQTTTTAPVSVFVDAKGSNDIAAAVGAEVEKSIPTIINKVRAALGPPFNKVPPQVPKP